MKSKVLTNLQAKATEADVKDSPDIMRQVHSGLEDGQFRTLNLGPDGLFFKRGGQVTVFIPHDELWKLETAPNPHSALRTPQS